MADSGTVFQGELARAIAGAGWSMSPSLLIGTSPEHSDFLGMTFIGFVLTDLYVSLVKSV